MQTRKRTKNRIVVVSLTLMAIVLAACILIIWMLNEKAQRGYVSRLNSVITSGYYPLADAMKADGYIEYTDTDFSKTDGVKEIFVSFDPEGGGMPEKSI